MESSSRAVEARRARFRGWIQLALFFGFAALMVLGVARGELRTLLSRAVNVCMECIGLG